MILPLKEVLGEVLGVNILNNPYLKNKNIVVIEIFSRFRKSILEVNIYELTHKCKEWAVKSNKEDKSINNGDHFYLNHIGSTHIGYFENYQCDVGYRGTDRDGTFRDLTKHFTADTEPECIFQACEWILKEMNK